MQDELIEAVEALTKVRNVQIDTDDGPKWVTGDPRLQQLEEAVYVSMGDRGGSAGLKSERSLIASDALLRAVTIQSQIGDWCRIADVPVTRDPSTDLDAWCAHRVALEPRSDDWHIQQLRKWAHEIDGMFTRPRTLDIEESCPVCGERTFPNENGDICTFPLKATADPFRVECKACGTAWEGPDAAEELAEEIGITPV
jgi:hypothetical protein